MSETSRPHSGLMDLVQLVGVGGMLRAVAVAVRACGREYACMGDEINTIAARATVRDRLRDDRIERERATEQARRCLAPKVSP